MYRCLLCLVVPLSLSSACAESGDAIEPLLVDGKADIADRVDLRDALEYSSPVRSEFVEDLEFHGYSLDAAAGAIVTIEITQKGSSRSTDSTLFVYGPQSFSGAFGTAAIAFDDDAGWGRLSRLRDLELDAGGRYLIVVGTHDGRGRGNYRIEARCESYDCSPATATHCRPQLADRIRACIEDTLAGPEEAPSPTDAIELCLDGEIVGAAFDEICAASPEPLCAEPLEDFFHDQVPACRDELSAEIE